MAEISGWIECLPLCSGSWDIIIYGIDPWCPGENLVDVSLLLSPGQYVWIAPCNRSIDPMSICMPVEFSHPHRGNSLRNLVQFHYLPFDIGENTVASLNTVISQFLEIGGCYGIELVYRMTDII